MRRIFILLILCSAQQMFAQSRVDEIRKTLFDKNSKQVLVVAHRGDWRFAPENSIPAVENSIGMGVDIVEIDIQKTKDGQLIVMHDKTLDRTTTGKGKVADWTLDSIKTLRLKNGIAIKTNISVPTLEEILLLAKGKVLLNLDKADGYFDDVYTLLKKTGTANQIIMKGSKPASLVKEQFGKYLAEIIYMPIVDLDKPQSKNILEEHLHLLQPAAFEFLFVSDVNQTPKEIINMLNGKSLIWYNTLWDTMAGGHDDDMALKDPKNAYGYLIDVLKCRIIQTDRPAYLIDYLKKRGLHN